jgi:predicted ATP-dependent endonuclease of OLD family
MILTIKNLGPIQEAEIDLSKSLLLFCGHNNTGKTYVSMAIYGFYHIVEESKYTYSHYFYLLSHDYIEDSLDKVIVDLKHIISVYKQEILKIITDRLKNYSYTLFGTNVKLFNNLVYNIHLSDTSKMEEAIFNSSFDYSIDEVGAAPTLDLNLSKKAKSNTLLIELSYKIDENQDWETIENTKELIKEESLIDEIIASTCIEWMIQETRARFFPAQRSAINIFSTELSLIKNKVLQGILKDNSLTELAQRRVNRYSQAIRDNLETAQDWKALSQKTSEYAYLADELEQRILLGKIVVGEYGELLYAPFENPALKLEMHLSSSLVESLATIAFYLRHLAQKNDCIIIDEPELNLHPDNQVKIARFLGRLINEGFKLIVSTHSDFIVKELSNLIVLANDFGEKDALLSKYQYQSKELIAKDKVGVYYFEQGKSTARPIPISNQGIEIESMDRAISELSQRSDDIYYSFIDSQAV